MEQFKLLLSNLLANRLDRVTVIYNLQKLKLDFDDDLPFVVLKYRLQLQIVELLSKEIQDESQSLYFEALKKEMLAYLEFYQNREQKTVFHCCLVGCLFTAKKHRSYIRHLQQNHPRDCNLVCQFGHKCTNAFSSVEAMLQHIDVLHKGVKKSRTEVVQVDIPCKCSVRRCYGAQFGNIKQLMLHLRTKHEGEVINCIFVDCEKKFSKSNSLKSHFFLKHLKLNQCSLKSINMVQIIPDSIEEIPMINASSEELLMRYMK